MSKKTPFGKGVYKNTYLVLMLSLLLICGVLSSMPTSTSYAHFAHLAHYNTGGMGLGKYYVNEQLDPEYTVPRQPTKISFSIQDTNGNDIYNIVAMVEIYLASTGERVIVYPWTKHDTGDFDLYYTFPQIGNYQIVISIANSDGSQINLYEVDPPRIDLGDNSNCNCARAIFNVNVSNNFGNFFQGAVLAGVGGIIIIFGFVLGFTYKSRRKSALYPSFTKNEVLKYVILLLAVASGIVHLVVYSEHGGLRIEYSIFLLTAGASQIAYSILYVLLTLGGESSSQSRESAKAYYRKSLIVNLFGLIGSSVLLGLYTYSVIFPPPLSPNNVPEDVDASGILDKSLELALVIGIIYLMRAEKKNLKSQLVSVE